MGFDLNGRNGNYFRATVWSWRLLHQMIASTNIFSDRELAAMNFNEGHWVTRDKAERLAEALDRSVTTSVQLPTDRTFSVHSDHSFCTDEGCPRVDHMSPYRIEADDVQEFVAFCRASGGFEVS
jgi:hypothetical protein